MGTGQHVLVVDGPIETEEVLRAVLEPQGLQVNRIRAHSQPDGSPVEASVVILHEDELSDAAAKTWEDVPRVIIGSAEIAEPADRAAHYIQKPYQYGELIRAIEQLLAARPPRRSTGVRRAG